MVEYNLLVAKYNYGMSSILLGLAPTTSQIVQIVSILFLFVVVHLSRMGCHISKNVLSLLVSLYTISPLC